MTVANKTEDLPFVAGADLSALQYYWVKLNSSKQVVAITAITDIPLGILQNKPDAQGKPASIAVNGHSKVVLGATLASGVLAGTSTAGKAIADATTNYTLGQIIDGGASGEVGSMLIRNYTAKA